MELDPAVDLGRSRSVGQILRSTLTLYTEYPSLLASLTALATALLYFDFLTRQA
jgi:hypothetical protein